MKKGVLITLIGITVIGIAYFGFEMYDFAEGVKKDSRKNLGSKKAEITDYQNSELSSFYKDYENEISEIIWTDEPPTILSGVIFKINENKYFEIDLDSIPELFQMNLERNWKLNDIGKSKIKNIQLVQKKMKNVW